MKAQIVVDGYFESAGREFRNRPAWFFWTGTLPHVSSPRRISFSSPWYDLAQLATLCCASDRGEKTSPKTGGATERPLKATPL